MQCLEHLTGYSLINDYFLSINMLQYIITIKTCAHQADHNMTRHLLQKYRYWDAEHHLHTREYWEQQLLYKG